MQKHAHDEPLLTAAPHDIDLEQAVIGSMLLRNDTIEQLAGLRAEHFFDPLHSALFEAIDTLIQNGKPANPVHGRSPVRRCRPSWDKPGR
jgi:replicative DNA helicase